MKIMNIKNLLICIMFFSNVTYSQVKDSWTSFSQSEEVDFLLPFFIEDNILWGSHDQKLAKYDLGVKRIEKFSGIDQNIFCGLSDGVTKYFFTKQDIQKVNGKETESVSYPLDFSSSGSNKAVLANGVLWIVQQDQLLRLSSGGWEKFYVKDIYQAVLPQEAEKLNSLGPNVWSEIKITDATVDNMNNISILIGNKILKFSDEKWSLTPFTITFVPFAVLQQYNNTFVFDQLGNIWCVGASPLDQKLKLYKITDKEVMEMELPAISPSHDNGGSLSITSITLDDAGGVWISLKPFWDQRAKGLVYYKAGKWSVFNEENSQLPDNIVLNVIPIKDNSVFISTAKGIAIFNGNEIISDSKKISSIVPLHEPYRVYDIFIDDSRGTWMATNEGLLEFKDNAWFHHVKENVRGYESLSVSASDNQFRRVLIDVNNLIWASDHTGVNSFDGESWNVYYNEIASITGIHHSSGDDAEEADGMYSVEVSSDDSHLFQDINDIATDNNGNMWAAVSSGALIKYSKEGWKLIKKVEKISCFAVDEKNNLWIGADKELMLFNGKEWINYNNFRNGAIKEIKMDLSGNACILTSNALLSFDGNTFEEIKDSKKMLSNKKVNCFVVDKRNYFFIGTDAGLFFYDGKIWIEYNIENSGILSNNVLSIAVDSEGQVWVGTDKGLCQFSLMKK